ncbi:MAG: alkaline phosphatase [Bacteroidetes bacterium]|nr:alkaline phosphatase [Bacteroidota bacterium]
MKVVSFLAILLASIVCQNLRLQEQSSPDAYHPKHRFSDWSVANAHSHNDYQQSLPFTAAYAAQFGSMEADVFFVRDSIFVGHEPEDILRHRMLTALYLDSLKYYIKKNGGFPYKNKSRQLQLLVDLKTEGIPTLAALIKLLKSYPELTHCKALSIVITGNRPPVDTWASYPSYIYFDGNYNETYPTRLLPKIAMISGDLADVIKWDGNGNINTSDSAVLAETIHKAHAMGKKIRFWDSPDFPNAWVQLIKARVDWLNTDHIPELARFLGKSKQRP